MRITPQDINGVVGIMPTPATAEADRWDAGDTIATGEVEKMVAEMLRAQVDVLMVLGTFGECATVTEDEVDTLADCLVQSVGRARPVFIGLTTLGTKETIRRGRAIMARHKVDGLFVGRPFWLPMDERAMVRYHQDLAEAMPGVPLILYDNPHVFKGKITPDAYREIAKIPEVIAAKHIGGPTLPPDLAAVGDDMKLLPVDTRWTEAAEAAPEQVTACWSGNVGCTPWPVMALSRAVRAHDWATARRISERLNWVESAMIPGGDLAKFMPYSIQVAHGRFKSAGLIDPGPARPPYSEAPAEAIECGLECGRRMRIVEAELADLATAAE